jgi:Zn-dependent peptidase ImmA (M78 family)
MLAGGSGGADIYLDRDQPPTRFRFSCAHELGHFIDRGAELSSEEAFVDKRSDANQGRADEVYANEFAGSLLMPEIEFRKAIFAGDRDLDLAERFQVSLDAVRYRRRLLGI